MLHKYLFVLALVSNSYCAVIVEVNQGKLRGTKDISRNGLKYFSFRGVPYAEAPLGKFRFQDPQELKPWTDIREAVEYASPCIQPMFGWTGKVRGSEDCLYLNVFTPQMNDGENDSGRNDSGRNDSGLPVMVWIHGGGFRIGAGSVYGPDYFMDKPIVLVTINYRLGVLGFLHFDDQHLPGNYGMKDQIAALKWVRDNIQAFGGDPTRIALAGQSSGAACVHWHMTSLSSAGLFHRAISQSGTAMAGWAKVSRRIAKDRALSVARLVGCNYAFVEETVKCLRRMPASELIKAQEKFLMKSSYPISFTIVSGKEDKSSWELNLHIPWLLGFTSNEGEFDAADLVSEDPDLENFNENYGTLLPIILSYNSSPRISTDSEMVDVTGKIKSFYFKNDTNTIDRGSVKQLTKLMTDFSIHDITEAALQHRGATYFYVFDHLQEHSFTEFVNEDYRPVGPVHSDDVISLFKTSYFPQQLNTEDTKISELMIELWTNFITFGDPNSTNSKYPWSALSGSDSIEFFNITENPEMRPWDWRLGFLFWRNLNLFENSFYSSSD